MPACFPGARCRGKPRNRLPPWPPGLRYERSPMPNQVKISVRDVSRTFFDPHGTRVEALRNVSFEVEDAFSPQGRDIGEMRVLLGPSGCGKSTLLRMIAGLDRPDSGQVLVNGKVVEGPARDRGMVFQKYTSFPWLTVADNIAYGPKI